MRRVPRWGEQEIEVLRAEWNTDKPAREIAERIGRPLKAIYLKAHKLGLPRKDDPNKIKLSHSDQWWLRQNYPHMRTELCALKLGISMRSCVRLARELGVSKTAQFMKETQAFSARKARESPPAHGTYPPKGIINENLAKGEAYRFKPGHTSTRKNKELCKSKQE